MGTTRPNCACHGEPMVLNGVVPSTGTVKHQCSVKNRNRAARWYETHSEFQANFRRLRDRRQKALRRRRKREALRGSV